MRQEKLRQAQLEARGYQVLRFIWEQLEDAEAIKERRVYAVARAV